MGHSVDFCYNGCLSILILDPSCFSDILSRISIYMYNMEVIWVKILNMKKKKFTGGSLSCLFRIQGYQSVSEGIPHHRREINIPEYLLVDNNNVQKQKDIVNQFNTFFANISKDISNTVPTDDNHYTHFMNQMHNRSMFLDPVSPADILKPQPNWSPNKVKVMATYQQNWWTN